MGLAALAVEKVFAIPRGLLRAGSAAGSPSRTEVAATMESSLWDPEPDAEGYLQRVTLSSQGVVTNDRFRASVRVPLPSLGLGIPTDASARTADIRLVMSRGGIPYAERRLVFARVQTEDETEAAYRLNLGKWPYPARETARHAGPVPAGAPVPDVRRGDVATAVVVVDPYDRTKDIEFLSGNFASGYWR